MARPDASRGLTMADPNRDDTSYYFNLARADYAVINLFFYLDKCELSHVRGTCVMIKNGHFVVRVPLKELDDHPVVWGCEVQGYFSVRDVDIVHCHFKSRLARLYNGPPDSMYLIFPLPLTIDHNQRRFSKRVNLAGDVSEGFRLWHGAMEGGGPDSLPEMRWLGLEKSFCVLAELSASGMRLEMPENSPFCARLSVNDLVLLKGDFGAPGKLSPLFVLGVIIRKMPKLEMEDVMCIGCHFLSWRKVEGRPGQTWFRADTQEGIGAIAQWLARNYRHVGQ